MGAPLPSCGMGTSASTRRIFAPCTDGSTVVSEAGGTTGVAASRPRSSRSPRCWDASASVKCARETRLREEDR